MQKIIWAIYEDEGTQYYALSVAGKSNTWSELDAGFDPETVEDVLALLESAKVVEVERVYEWVGEK